MSHSVPELEKLVEAVGRAAEATRHWRQRAGDLENRVRQLEKELEELRQDSGKTKADLGRLQRHKSEIRTLLNRIRSNLATLEEPAHKSAIQKS